MAVSRHCRRGMFACALFLLTCAAAQNVSVDGSASKIVNGSVLLTEKQEGSRARNFSSELLPSDGGVLRRGPIGMSFKDPPTKGEPNKRVSRQTIKKSLQFGPTLVTGCSTGRCVGVHVCSAAALIVSETCTLVDGSVGVCCPLPGVHLGASPLMEPVVHMMPVPDTMKASACQEGLDFLKQLDTQEIRLSRDNITVRPNTPERAHQRFFRVKRSALEMNDAAMMVNQASSSLVQRLDLSNDESIHGLKQVGVSSSPLGNVCPVAPVCNQVKYRSVDGTCNNENKPLFGKSETAFARLVPPAYDDGVSAPRSRSVNGMALPNVRIVSLSLVADQDVPDPQFTLGVMQWGQFIDHDLTHTPFQHLKENNEGIQCCKDGQEITGPERHPMCLPIILPDNDPFFGLHNMHCLNFIRSMQALNQDCTFGPAEQMNQVSHWMDGSNVYGSSAEEASHLRLGDGGMLKTSAGGLLPIDETLSDADCRALESGGHCFFAGDSRVNEQPGLTAIHTLFHREHNRVAQALRSINPTWSDEALYQETRRIVVAEIQHITYNEWLPVIVGDQFMDSYNLKPQLGSFRFDYNSNINPHIMNEFATAAFRFGHSLVQGDIRMQLQSGEEIFMRLKDHFSSPHLFSEHADALDMLSRSLTRDNGQAFDTFISEDLSKHLFETPEKGFGFDLISLNIQRGRDHGIPPYNAIRQVCGLPRARTFMDFSDQIPVEFCQKMETLYANVDDVDFFAGGLAERPVSGGLLGWTFLCIVGEQFQKLKMGDRFFYDLGGQPVSFTKDQLDQLQRASWARILCDNTDNFGPIQPFAFRLVNPMNSLVDCAGIARVDLGPWAGEQPQA